MTLPKRDSHGRFTSKRKTPVKVLKDKVFASVLTESDYVLVLKAVESTMSSTWRRSFVYPKSGMVEAPDWNPIQQCGNGLHGFLWGEGWCGVAGDIKRPKWLVLKVLRSGIISLDRGDKVKFQKGEVIFCGGLKDAANLIMTHHEGKDKRTIGAHKIGKGLCYLQGGAMCNLKGGDFSTLIGDSNSKLEAGGYSTLIGGPRTIYNAGMKSTFIRMDGDGDVYTFEVDGVNVKANTKYTIEYGGHLVLV